MIDATEYEPFRRSFLSEADLELWIPHQLTGYVRDGNAILLDCTALVCEKTAIRFSYNQMNRSLNDSGERVRMAVRLDFLAEDLIRIRMEPGTTVHEHPTAMLVDHPPATVPFTIRDDGALLIIETALLRVCLAKQPWQLTIADRNGAVLYEQYKGDPHSATGIARAGMREGSGHAPEAAERAATSYPLLECYPFGMASDRKRGRRCFSEAVRMAYDEHFYGFGERFSRLDKNGQEVRVWQMNPLGVSTRKSYKNIPFFMSSRGYGLFLNSSCRSRFDMGSYFFKAYSMEVEDDQWDCFFMYGPGFKRILGHYSRLTGRSAVPPRWSFGVWMSRNCYRTRQELETVAATIRAKELPCDVLHIDWDYFKQRGVCDFEFDAGRFPDPAAMIAGLKRLGFKISLWQMPYIGRQSKLYAEGLRRGYFAAHDDGQPAERAGEAIIDFSNPEAVAWYQGYLKRLLQLGIRVIKTDFGENARETYNNVACSGTAMHNLYPLLYNRAAYEACAEVWGKDALIWGRSAFAGCQRYPVYWGGDASSDFDGLYHSLRAGLSLGLSGFPFWSHDVGGYFGRPEPDVYIRWLQWGMFSSHVRFHGTTEREPWHFGAAAEAIYRKYARLRYSLIPYIYSEAHHCAVEGLPLLRPLVLEFQDDPTTYAIDDQYLFGGSFLVAPVLSAACRRRIYLPEGRWLDHWTGRAYPGRQWLEYAAPLDTLPLFVRDGSIIPMTEPANYIGEKNSDRILLDIYLSDRAEYEMRDDETTVRFAAQVSGDQLVIDIGPSPYRYWLRLNGYMDCWRVCSERDGELPPLPEERLETVIGYAVGNKGLLIAAGSAGMDGMRITVAKPASAEDER